MKKLLFLIISIMMILIPLEAKCDDEIRVTLDGQEIVFDVPPQIIDERTLVPMRAIFEALGADVEWNGELQQIIADTQNKHIEMFIGTDVMNITKSGNTFMDTVKLDVPPQIIDGRTLVPVRAVSESLDCKVDWDSVNRTVIITSPVPDVPDEGRADITIEYDDTIERQASYVRDFSVLSVDVNEDGNFAIKYKLRTFYEGRGDVTVTFRCLDSDNKQVDTFGGVFRGTDYTWSWHESDAVISGKTAKIELVLEEKTD